MPAKRDQYPDLDAYPAPLGDAEFNRKYVWPSLTRDRKREEIEWRFRLALREIKTQACLDLQLTEAEYDGLAAEIFENW